MPFSRPTLNQLIDTIAGDIESQLPGADARLRRNVLNVIARILAGAAHGLYGYQEFIARQGLYDTAEAEFLERWASIYGISRLAATFATGDVVFAGTDGSTVVAGSELQRSDGLLFTVDADVTIAGGTAVASLTANTPGSESNTNSGVQLTLTATASGINSVANVDSSGIAGGVDIESDNALRDRLLSRVRLAPHGGAAHDYVQWAKEAHPAVTRVWVFPLELGDGTVVVRFVTDNEPSGIIPSAQIVSDVQTYIDSVRPVTAIVTVDAPTAVPLDLDISLNPNTTAVQQAVTSELQDMLSRVAAPGGTIPISKIREAVSIASGEEDHAINVPAADVLHAVNQIAVMGNITWSTL